MDERKKGFLYLAAGLLCFAVVWGLVKGFSGRWPWGTPTGPAGPSWSVREAMNSSGDVSSQGANPQEEGKPAGKSSGNWVIYLTGEVARPGIHEIPADSRLYEAVQVAGGLTGNADKEGINLAAKLADGVHVHIPRAGEGKTPSTVVEGSLGEQAGERVGESMTGVNLSIDVNRATAVELEKLPGIGPKLAQQIVEDRTANGPFSTPEDLLRVKGIGPAKLEKIKEMIILRP